VNSINLNISESRGVITVILNPEITLLSQIIAILILLVIIIVALFEIQGIVRDVLTVMFLMLMIINYGVIYAVAESGVSIAIYPLTIVEQYDPYGSIYPDLGQISLLFILIMWRRELLKYLKLLREK
jgi:glucan phosphoethanolaminetransferase (alkaline phosphatase superfamily)